MRRVQAWGKSEPHEKQTQPQPQPWRKGVGSDMLEDNMLTRTWLSLDLEIGGNAMSNV